jgi:hypothetical protein
MVGLAVWKREGEGREWMDGWIHRLTDTIVLRVIQKL